METKNLENEQVGKAFFVSMPQARRLWRGISLSALLVLPLALCLLWAHQERPQAVSKESDVKSRLFQLARQVSSFPSSRQKAAGMAVQTVRSFNGSQVKPATHPSNMADEPVSKLASNDPAGMTLELIHMVFRLPLKRTIACLNVNDVIAGDEQVIADHQASLSPSL